MPAARLGGDRTPPPTLHGRHDRAAHARYVTSTPAPTWAGVDLRNWPESAHPLLPGLLRNVTNTRHPHKWVHVLCGANL